LAGATVTTIRLRIRIFGRSITATKTGALTNRRSENFRLAQFSLRSASF
jgi:hypothetical protein